MKRTLVGIKLEPKHLLALHDFGMCTVYSKNSLALGCFGVEIGRLFDLKRTDSDVKTCRVRLIALQSEKQGDGASLILQSVLSQL